MRRRPFHASMRTTEASPWQARFALLAGIWGSSFLLIKVADESLAPLQVALGRVLFGSATVLGVLALRRQRLRFTPAEWLHLFVVALLFNSLPFVCFAWGETHTSSVLAGIWNATTPLWTLPFALLFVREEPPSRAQAASVAVGFAGVLTVLGPWRGEGGSALAGNLACVAGAACYGLGFAYSRRHLTRRHEPLTLSAGQLVCATVQLAVVTLPVDGWPGHVSLRSFGSVAALGALGTGIAYLLNYAVIRAAGITVASTVTYVVPLFSTVLGVAVLSEPLHWNAPLGGAIVLLGAALAQNRHRGLTGLWRRRWRLRSAV
jgi:drug/metabolite transporter (DMT)-like permease